MSQTTYPVVCERCGQTATCEIVSGARLVCSPCVRLERQSQGESVPLFNPAPAQMPGQTEFSLAAARDGRPMNSDEQRADRWARIAASRENPGT